jgi:hypothetical protein
MDCDDRRLRVNMTTSVSLWSLRAHFTKFADWGPIRFVSIVKLTQISETLMNRMIPEFQYQTQ